MNPAFRIFVDSSCDLPAEILNSCQFTCLPLSFTFDGSDRIYSNGDMDAHTFYTRMENGETARTSAVNTEAFLDAFTPALESGSDVLCLIFSSGLSSTYSAACAAREQLKEAFPTRRVAVLDTLCASAGFGLLLSFVREKVQEGASMDEIISFVEETKGKIAHWFTVSDLTYLRRGGRISSAAAFAAGVLNIRPVMHMDDSGHLVAVKKVRGGKAALNGLIGHFESDALQKDGRVYLCHSACEADARYVQQTLEERFGARVERIVDIGPVIGAHCGPETLGLFFLADKR